MKGTARATTVAVVARGGGSRPVRRTMSGMALAGVNVEVLCSDHDRRLVPVVDDFAVGSRISAAWADADGPAGAAPSLLL